MLYAHPLLSVSSLIYAPCSHCTDCVMPFMRNSFIPKSTVIAKSCGIHSMFLAVVKPATNSAAGGRGGVWKGGGPNATPTVELQKVLQYRPFLKAHSVAAGLEIVRKCA